MLTIAVLRLRLLEQEIVEVLQREVVEREAAAPRLGEGGLREHDHRQEHRERADEQA